MDKFFCGKCNHEILSLWHVCGRTERKGGEVIVGSTSWGNPGFTGKSNLNE